MKALGITLLTVTAAGCSQRLVAEKIPTNLSDNVVTCGANARCSNKSMFGRSYKVITTAQFTVMVSISTEGAYMRADVSIANNTGSAQTISPEEFRLEVTSPKAKVLQYVSPARLQNLTVGDSDNAPAVAAPVASASAPISVAEPVSVMVAAKAAEASGAVPMTPNIDELFATAKREQAMKAAAEKQEAQKLLAAAAVPANDVVRGRVYFEKDSKAQQANVVLPVAGLVFEFPYSLSF